MKGIPLGSKLMISGQIYIVEDRVVPFGQIGLYMNNHEDADAFATQYAEVYLVK